MFFVAYLSAIWNVQFYLFFSGSVLPTLQKIGDQVDKGNVFNTELYLGPRGCSGLDFTDCVIPCLVGWFSIAAFSCLDVGIEGEKSLLEHSAWFGLIYPRMTEEELGKY